MTSKILSLFLILIAVGAGLCSAQTAEKKHYYLVESLFFEGMPPGMDLNNATALITHEDGKGNEVTELRLHKGFVLSEEVKKYATPAEEVPGVEALLMSYRGEKGQKLPIIGAVQTLKKEEWIGKPFPAFWLKDTPGKEWTNAELEGRPMVLNFWYIGCAPCIREMPALNRWMELFPDVTYLATTFNDATQIKRIVENRPFRFAQIADELFFFNTFGVKGMPVTILTDKKGIIRYIEEGSGGAKLRYMQDKLQELVSE